MEKRSIAGVMAMRVCFWLAIMHIGGLAFGHNNDGKDHPWLILRDADMPALQARAASAPWSAMKADAIKKINTLSYNASLPVFDKSVRMADIMGAGALAWVLDTNQANRNSYKTKLYNALLQWNDLRAGLETDWNGSVPPGGAFFNSVLALDIIHDSLTATERANVEARLQAVADWYEANQPAWEQNLYAARGIWALYANHSSNISRAKHQYRGVTFNKLNDSGVYTEGPAYGAGRNLGDFVNHARDGKVGFMDVLEFTGTDNEYYSDSRMQGLFEWLTRGAVTPTKKLVVFGDTYVNFNFTTGVGSLKMSRFSPQAARNMAWILEGSPAPPGRLLHYLYYEEPLPPPEKPTSFIWADTAAFWENNPSTDSLMGALWNSRKCGGSHCHKEVNALFIAAYGESVLVNAGYSGASNDVAPGFSYDWANERAESGNTVLLGGLEPLGGTGHGVGKVGAGITEGFTSALLDYASGNSGIAMHNGVSRGQHQRSFVFVHPQDSRPGYFVVFDEMTRTAGDVTTANVLWHGLAESVTTVTANQEYRWTVRQDGSKNVFLTGFLATPPSSVQVKNGGMGGWGEGMVGKYLYSTYPLDNTGQTHMVTVLFPWHEGRPLAPGAIQRVSGANVTGATVDLGSNIVDTVLESEGNATLTNGPVSWRGLAALYRFAGTAQQFFLVRQGVFFSDGASPRRGFTAEDTVSLHLRNNHGWIISPGTNVTFNFPNISAVQLNRTVVPVLASGPHWVRVRIPAGSHEVHLLSGAQAGNPSPPRQLRLRLVE